MARTSIPMRTQFSIHAGTVTRPRRNVPTDGSATPGDRDRPDQGEQRHDRQEELLVFRDLAEENERRPAEGEAQQPSQLAADEREERADR